ncbi:hypothetical protein R6Q57_004600 [Mikania cordata]
MRVMRDLMLVDNFHGDTPAGVDVSGVINLGESTAAEEPSDLILTEQRIGRGKSHAGSEICDLWHRRNDTGDRIGVGGDGNTDDRSRFGGF